MKYFERVTMEGFNQRAKKDKRKKVNFLICSYLNEQGQDLSLLLIMGIL